jgi:N-methylhydantoinase A
MTPAGAQNGNGRPEAYIGVDVGGTHTDVAVVMGERMERGKALTTYDDFSRGVLEAIGVAAEQLEMTQEELLGKTRVLINGTTVVTNAITQLRGSNVGVVVTAGFKDTFRIAGGPRKNEYDDHLQTNVPDLVARDAIAEVQERLNYAGEEVTPLNEDELEQGVKRLVEEVGIDALAICFLSSYINPEHELRAEEVIKKLYPDLFVTASHRVFPVRGENRRWTTAVLNSFVQDRAETYLDTVSRKLSEAGLGGALAFFQGLGGGISRERAAHYPLALLGSGPAGGAIGANELGKRMGKSRVLLADMGGTSFDTGIINENDIHIEKNIEIGPFETGVNLVDVVSIGAGGGSIAWVSERGAPQVGPQSAGSTPGPAAYGKGGEDPTVTDAMTVMGFIDPDNYLGGRVQLDIDLATRAIEEKFASSFGWSLEEAASAVHDLVVVNMATAVHEVSVEKGYDPRDFVFLAYGGTLPLFASQIAARLGISTVVIPQNSSVFSALGLLASDFVVRADQTVAWDLSRTDEIDRVNQAADELAEQVLADMRAEGFADEDIQLLRGADFRFQGQIYELTMPLADRPLTSDDAATLGEQFAKLYEQTYGEGTAWKGVPEELLNYTVTAIGRQPRPPTHAAAEEPASLDQIRKGEREIYLPMTGSKEPLPIYDDLGFTPGTLAEGPAIVDAVDTTVFVPPQTRITRDEHMNYVVTREG